MYRLTLTKDERAAIDWVGYRYVHGDDFYKLLVHECEFENDWDYDGDVTFSIPEHVAWEMVDKLPEDDFACFAPEFESKMWLFLDTIV